MSGQQEACKEYTRNRVLTNRKNKDESLVISFFKVLIGAFAEMLYLPPKCKKIMSELIDQKVELEDAGGRRWTVEVAKCDDQSLVFKQGWHEFCLEHDLEIGDFLVFHRINPSHFTVQIFGKSAFEKVEFSQETGNQKKRARTENDSSSKYGKVQRGSCNAFSVLDVERQRTSSPVRLRMVKPKDDDEVEADRRAALWDLSVYEMQETSLFDRATNL